MAVGRWLTVLREVVGFRLDDDGHWVAVLDCHHGRHVRHRPPWEVRAWTQSPAGRADRIGTEFECPKCDWAEQPEHLVPDRTTAEWSEQTLPAGLRRDHRVASGVWGRVRVMAGSVRFRFADGLGGEIHADSILHAGDHQPIPPNRPHRLEVIGPVRLAVDFFVAEGDPAT